MFGAIVGDIAGSTFERHNFKFECCHIFEHGSQFTDDTVLTLATASHFIYGEPYSSVYRQYGRPNGFVTGCQSRWGVHQFSTNSITTAASPKLAKLLLSGIFLPWQK
jgi:hypothetical protein